MIQAVRPEPPQFYDYCNGAMQLKQKSLANSILTITITKVREFLCIPLAGTYGLWQPPLPWSCGSDASIHCGQWVQMRLEKVDPKKFPESLFWHFSLEVNTMFSVKSAPSCFSPLNLADERAMTSAKVTCCMWAWYRHQPNGWQLWTQAGRKNIIYSHWGMAVVGSGRYGGASGQGG